MLAVVKSSASRTGYLHVVEPRAGQFHAKLKLPGETRQSFLAGAACKTAQEAALSGGPWQGRRRVKVLKTRVRLG